MPEGVLCPRCKRVTALTGRRWVRHTTTPRGFQRCALSLRPVPFEGTSDAELRGRAFLAGELAAQLRDEDPARLWVYLNAFEPLELRRMLVIALAAIPVDRPVSELYDWVRYLARGEADVA